MRGQSNRESLAAEAAASYGGELARQRTAQSFCVPKADIAAQGYDLSLNRYKEVVHEEVAHRPPGEILASLGKLEAEIQQGMEKSEKLETWRCEVSVIEDIRSSRMTLVAVRSIVACIKCAELKDGVRVEP